MIRYYGGLMMGLLMDESARRSYDADREDLRGRLPRNRHCRCCSKSTWSLRQYHKSRHRPSPPGRKPWHRRKLCSPAHIESGEGTAAPAPLLSMPFVLKVVVERAGVADVVQTKSFVKLRITRRIAGRRLDVSEGVRGRGGDREEEAYSASRHLRRTQSGPAALGAVGAPKVS